MIRFDVSVEIDRPVDAVFAHVTDPARLSTWQTNVATVIVETAGPFGVGTRLRETRRAPGGKEVVSLVEVVEHEPGRVFGLHVLEGTPIDGRITFAPRDGGTLLTFAVHGALTGVLRLAEPLLGRLLRRQFTAYCAELRRVLEAPG